MSRQHGRFSNSLRSQPFTVLMKFPVVAPIPTCIASRRQFFHQASRGAVAAWAVPALVQRVGGTARAAASGSISVDRNDDPLGMSATKLAGLIRSRRLSVVEVVDLYLRRIEAVNPRLRAVVTICAERARAEARAADAAVVSGQPLPALHGVPMTISDVFDTAAVVSTAGTAGRGGFVPAKDATVVARLRAAGAILLGKTNTTEFGSGGRDTVNPLFGRTRNPYADNLPCGGPAGGAAVNVAAGGAAFDLGSGRETSLRCAALANGLAGLRPTFGRVPRTGHVAHIGGALDFLLEVGPLARRVEDLELLLPVLAGADPGDPMTFPVPLPPTAEVKLKGLRIALCPYVSDEENRALPEAAELVRRCAKLFTDLGCAVVEDMPPKQTEMREIARDFLRATGPGIFRRMCERHGTPLTGGASGDEMSSPDFTRTLDELDALKSAQLTWFEDYDLLLYPGLSPVAPPTGSETGSDDFVPDAFSLNGWPAGVVRVGTSSISPRLPLGVQVIAHPWREDRLLTALAHLEARHGGWQKPAI